MNNDPSLNWDQVRHFVAVARAGSVVGAARRLGVSHATVLRNVTRLEASLGVRLFDRVRSGYRITADGDEVLAAAAAMEAQAEALLRRARGKSPSPEGTLKLAVTDASLFDPMPMLARFRDRYPRIELALEEPHGGAEQSLTQLRCDAALMVTNTPPEDLVGRQLARLRLACFRGVDGASNVAKAAERTPVPAAAMRWVVWRSGEAGVLDEAWHEDALRRLTGRPEVVLRCDKHADALLAVRAGIGAGLLRDAHHPGLLRLDLAEPQESFGIWLLTHPDLRRAGRVRALFDFVAEAHQGGSLPTA